MTGGSIGVYVKYRAVGTVTNSGTINGVGDAGIDLAHGGSVGNDTVGSISGARFGVFITGGVGSVSNNGRISGRELPCEAQFGRHRHERRRRNHAWWDNRRLCGSRSSGHRHERRQHQRGLAGGAGVDLGSGGSVTNSTGGIITGTAFGVFATGAAAAVTNNASISGYHGVALEAGGTLTNTSGATIAGGTSASLPAAARRHCPMPAPLPRRVPRVRISRVAAASPTSRADRSRAAASASSSPAAAERSPMTAAYPASTISGSTCPAAGLSQTMPAPSFPGLDRCRGDRSSGTVTNGGTISGGTNSVRFSGTGANRLVVKPTAVFNGAVAGASGEPATRLNWPAEQAPSTDCRAARAA